MKLLRLKINEQQGFRSLHKGFEVRFLREWDYNSVDDVNPYILAGPNGSGKSNVLEALAAIFYHIECVYLNFRPRTFDFSEMDNANGFRAEFSSPDAFEVEYFIPVPEGLKNKKTSGNAHIKIEKEAGKNPVVSWINREMFDEGSNVELERTEAKQLLPKYILGYSSGENEILSLPFYKMRFIHFDEYKEMLLTDNAYGTSEGRLIFLDNELNQAIVLSNFLLQDRETLKPFEEELGIAKIKQFRIIIRKNIKIDLDKLNEMIDEYPGLYDELESKEDSNYREYKELEITKKIQHSIDYLIKCSTSHCFDEGTGCYFIDYWVNDATREAFKLYFGSAKELFQVFQILLTLNLYSVNDKLKKELYESSSLYINETVPVLASDERIMRFKDFLLEKRGVNGTIYSKSLSDGEHQFMHSLGLCLLYKDDNCLFLLDEPETHFNPDWRAKFISRLRECFEKEKLENTMREMLITTHTPFLISDSKPEHVLLFEKDLDNGEVKVKRPGFNTLGASINKITIEAFKKSQTIGGYAEKKLNEFRKRYENGEDIDVILEDTNSVLGDSVEKILFIDSILKRKEEQ